MILPILGICTIIPSRHDEIKRRLRSLGVTPTGDYNKDKALLKKALEDLKEIQEEASSQKIIIQQNNESKREGAEALAQYNRLFFKI
jgi:hypothetical protein